MLLQFIFQIKCLQKFALNEICVNEYEDILVCKKVI